MLKEKYRIIGDPFDRPDDANTSEIPLLLMSEQVQVLLEQGKDLHECIEWKAFWHLCTIPPRENSA